MAGALIDASLRRATLIAEARGFITPDTRPVLDPAPQIIIEADDEDVFLDFDDGQGYTTNKNAYKSYGSKSVWIHNGEVQNTGNSQAMTSDLDNADEGFLPVYNPETGKYEAVGLRGCAAITIQRPTDRFYNLIHELPWDIEIIDTFSAIEAGPATVDFPSGTLSAGDPLQVEVDDTSLSSSFLKIQINFVINLRTEA